VSLQQTGEASPESGGSFRLRDVQVELDHPNEGPLPTTGARCHGA
jgi:hypothetical protein